MSHVGVSVKVVTLDDTVQQAADATQHATTRQVCRICNEPFHVNELEVVLECCCPSHHAECFNNWYSDSENNEPKCTVCRASFSLKPFYTAMTSLATGSVRLSANSSHRSVKLLHVHVVGDGDGSASWEQSRRAALYRENMSKQTQEFRTAQDEIRNRIRVSRAREHAMAAERRLQQERQAKAAASRTPIQPKAVVQPKYNIRDTSRYGGQNDHQHAEGTPSSLLNPATSPMNSQSLEPMDERNDGMRQSAAERQRLAGAAEARQTNQLEQQIEETSKPERSDNTTNPLATPDQSIHGDAESEEGSSVAKVTKNNTSQAQNAKPSKGQPRKINIHPTVPATPSILRQPPLHLRSAGNSTPSAAPSVPNPSTSHDSPEAQDMTASTLRQASPQLHQARPATGSQPTPATTLGGPPIRASWEDVHGRNLHQNTPASASAQPRQQGFGRGGRNIHGLHTG